MAFVKLFQDILQSTIWQEDAETRLIWLTILLLADREGLVRATAPGIAHEARVPLPRVIETLARLEGPDEYSRTPDNEGRRLQRVPGGYLVLNYPKYRERRDSDERRAQWAAASRRYRERKKEKAEPASSVIMTNDDNQPKQKQKHRGAGAAPQSACAPAHAPSAAVLTEREGRL